MAQVCCLIQLGCKVDDVAASAKSEIIPAVERSLDLE
jgi:hypothetical protein